MPVICLPPLDIVSSAQLLVAGHVVNLIYVLRAIGNTCLSRTTVIFATARTANSVPIYQLILYAAVVCLVMRSSEATAILVVT